MKFLGVEMEDKTALIIGGVGLVLIYWTGLKAKEAVSDALDLVNPTSHKNIFYSGVNGIGSAVSGDNDWTLGYWLYDVLHPNELQALREKDAYGTYLHNQNIGKGNGATGSW